MAKAVFVLGEALMDCMAQADGQLRPRMGGSPYNLARAAARRGADVVYLNPLSSDLFGQELHAQLTQDGVRLPHVASRRPTSLAVVQLRDGQPDYGFYREGIADRDYTVEEILACLRGVEAGLLHTGSLALVPPEHEKVLSILRVARSMGWVISVDVNLRPRLADDLGAYLHAVWQAVALADWVKASDEDLLHLGVGHFHLAQASAAADKLREHVATSDVRFALTFGVEGAYLEVGGARKVAPAWQVTVADTVGAGDTFWGNVLADWVMAPGDADQRLDDTLRLAMIAAAMNCEQMGCTPPLVSALNERASHQPGTERMVHKQHYEQHRP